MAAVQAAENYRDERQGIWVSIPVQPTDKNSEAAVGEPRFTISSHGRSLK